MTKSMLVGAGLMAFGIWAYNQIKEPEPQICPPCEVRLYQPKSIEEKVPEQYTGINKKIKEADDALSRHIPSWLEENVNTPIKEMGQRVKEYF